MYSAEDSKSRWEFFQKHQWVSPEFSSSLIFQSWQRCSRLMNAYEWTKPHVASGFTLSSMKRRTESIINCSIRAIEDNYDFLEGEKLLLFVTDDNGCLMHVMGNEELNLKMKEIGIKEGSFISEDRIGTNAVSFCIETLMPSTVVGCEHFKRELHELLTVASPIIDAYGKLLGTIAMVKYANQARREDPLVTSMCAKEVGLQLHILHEQKLTNSLLSAHNAALDYMDDGVITWDSEQLISYVSPQVGTLLGVDSNTLLGRNIFSAVRFAPDVTRCIEQSEHLRRHQTTFEIDAQFVDAMVTYQYSTDGTNLLFIHPVNHVEDPFKQTATSDIQYSFESLNYASQQMQHVISVAKRLIGAKEPVLLTGEEGVGKSHLALVMHNESSYCRGDFINVDCSSIESSLLEVLILGSQRDELPSKFELAHHGTLYISHIEQLSMKLQFMLLKFLDSGFVTTADGKPTKKFNLQLITSSAGNLKDRVEQGDFSRQLYYVLSSNELYISPLRERKEDIQYLINSFVTLFERQHRASVAIDKSVVELMASHAWHGNTSQLRNIVNRILLNRESDNITVDHIPASVRTLIDERSEESCKKTTTLESLEKQAIIQAWEEFDGRMQDMAKALDIGRTTLWRKIKKYDLSQMMD
ncbi:TPA: PTS-dependent dihydroxyacetone kinase operon transcriptional regulator DhaR [Vibrio vulnificus]|nr:PTS-dependent dihydroxyacetone kinase operon transcriptional regulator DhaR [Vibrio vulnificus]